MGWKSTKEITKEKAIELIARRMYSATDNQLAYAVEVLGYGDETDLPYYGCNFMIVDKESQEEEYLD